MISLKSRFLPVLLLLMGITTASLAQEKCGTVAYEKLRAAKNSKLETKDQFEKWMQSKVSQLKLKTLSSGRTQTPTYTIPVVVHVIHNGEAVGVGTNIPDAQIFSQIDSLNKDYPRLNFDASQTLSQFVPVAGSIDIQFVLAKQDPEGLPTNGILRVHGTKSGWLMSDNSQFKSLSYWSSDDYLNIWIVNFVDPNGIIGYAQLPVSSLDGLEGSSDDPLTDGVAIDYRAFGYISNPVSGFTGYNLGRTATHEIGHMLGLRHIWGDDGGACTGSDFCDDTPNQADSNNGHCQTVNVTDVCTTTGSIMYQNYMDYTDDACMNLFSQDQVGRMVVVLGNSPRRNSWLSSLGATDPTTVANDLGIKRIISPGPFTCPTFDPSIVVRNYGSNPISSAQITFALNGVVQETKDVTFSSAIAHLDSTNVVFLPVTLVQASNTFDFQVTLTNGVSDGKATNNEKTQTAIVPAQGTLPLFEAFNTTPATWNIINSDGGKTWTNVTAPNSNANNTAMTMNFYDYDSQGEVDQLVSPSFDFTMDTVAVLKFDRSYALYSGSTSDRLRVIVFTGCNYDQGFEIFNKSSAALATAATTTQAFVPAGANDWKTETIPLTQFLGQPDVRVAFVATNDFGNNLYLDNVRIITGSYADLNLVALKKPGPVICINNPDPVITVRNDGTFLINSFSVQTKIGNGNPSTQTITGANLDSGDEQDFTLNSWTLADGVNDVVITLNVTDDALPVNNSLSVRQVVSNTQDIIPIRENFDSGFPGWTIVSQNQEAKWISAITPSYDISLEYPAFTNLNIGSESWLTSPVLDFSKAAKASVFFDLSYAQSSSRGSERLQVMASTDCGQTYPLIPYDKSGIQLKNSNTSTSWSPQNATDWSHIFVSLDPLIGNNQVRLAFLVTNGNGNNLYLDNIEIFTDDNSDPIPISTSFSVYNNMEADFKITFNLQEKETVYLKVYNMIGQVVIDSELPDTLNQTYDVDLSGQQSGLYIVKLQMGDEVGTAKVFKPN